MSEALQRLRGAGSGDAGWAGLGIMGGHMGWARPTGSPVGLLGRIIRRSSIALSITRPASLGPSSHQVSLMDLAC